MSTSVGCAYYNREERHPLPPFFVLNPVVLKDEILLQLGIQKHTGYRVVHDLLPHAPWGHFKIFWNEQFVGCTLSYPDWEACRWVHKNDRRGK